MSQSNAKSIQDLLETVDVILWEVDIETLSSRYVSPQIEQILGYSVEEWLEPIFWQSCVHPDDLDLVVEGLRQVQTAVPPTTQLEYRIRDKNGRYHWFIDNISAVYQNNTLIALRGVKVDHTQRKQVDLQETEKGEVVQEFGRIVSSSLDHRIILRESLMQLKRVLRFDSASIYLNDHHHHHEFVTGLGFDDKEMTSRAAKDLLENSPVLAQMAKDHQPILSPDVRQLEGWIWVPGTESIRSFMAVPLLTYEQVMVGAFMIDNRQVDFFTEDDLRLVVTLSQHLSIAVENAWLYEATQQELAEKQLLIDAGTAVSSTLDLDAVLTRLAQAMGDAIGVTSVYISDWVPQNITSTVLAEYFSENANDAERVSDLGETYNLTEKYGGQLNWLNEGQPAIEHIDDPDLPPVELEHLIEYGAMSILKIPLIVKDETMGYAELWESRYRREFTELEIKMVQSIAQHAAMALANAQLYAVEKKRRQEAEIISQLAGELTSTLNLDKALQRVIDIIRRNVPDIHNCAISLFEHDGQFLRTRSSWASESRYHMIEDGKGVDIDKTIFAKKTVEERCPIIIYDFSQEKIHLHRVKVFIKRGVFSALYIPLIIQEQVIGILHIHVWHKPRRFSLDEVTFCQSLSNFAAIAIHNADLFLAERRQLKLARTLQEVGALLTAQLGLQQVFERVFDLLAQVVTYDSVSLQLVTSQRGHFDLVAGRGFDDLNEAGKFADVVSPNSLKRLETKPFWAIISDTYQEPTWVRHEHDVSLDTIRCWIGAALMVKGQIIGILNVDSYSPNRYDWRMGETVAAFANQAAVAIENARLHEQTRQAAQELSLLQKVGLDTAVTLDIDHLLEQTTDLITNTLYKDVFGFVISDSENKKLYAHASYKPDVNRQEFSLTGIVGHVYQTGEPYMTGDTQNDPYYFEGILGMFSEIAVPLQVHGIIIGVLNAEHPEKDAFDWQDLRFLTTLAAQVATAIERAQLYETLQEQTDVLAQMVSERTAELKAERDRTLAILENAGEGIMFVGTNGVIQYANPTMEKQTGYSREELFGRSSFMLRKESISEQMNKVQWQQFSEMGGWSGEAVNKRRDGTFYDVSVVISPVKNSIGEITGFVTIQSDITRLKEVDRLKSKFVSNVSHELRTPLTNIKLYLALLERVSHEKQPRYLTVLNYETSRLTRLIQDLLDLSRLDMELQVNETAVIQFVPILSDILETFRAQAETSNLSFSVSLPDNNCDIKIAQNHFEQLFTNLLGNACAYTPSGGTIHLEANLSLAKNDEMKIAISNSGAGIPQEDIPHLFERFYRGVKVQEMNIPGTGLGLSICHEIVTRYGGRIEVESEVDGMTMFTVYLKTAVSPTQ